MRQGTSGILRATATIAGVAVLGAALSGTAFAATAQDAGDDATGYQSNSFEDVPEQDSTNTESFSGFTGTPGLDDMHSFEMPSRSVAAKDESFIPYFGSDDEEDPQYPGCEFHYPGRNYNQPYNGDKSDDNEYDSSDYDPDCYPYQGTRDDQENGYQGYHGHVGTDERERTAPSPTDPDD